MTELIDLSQESYPGMPLYKGMPDFHVQVHTIHEQWEGLTDAQSATQGFTRSTWGNTRARTSTV